MNYIEVTTPDGDQIYINLDRVDYVKRTAAGITIAVGARGFTVTDPDAIKRVVAKVAR